MRLCIRKLITPRVRACLPFVALPPALCRSQRFCAGFSMGLRPCSQAPEGALEREVCEQPPQQAPWGNRQLLLQAEAI